MTVEEINKKFEKIKSLEPEELSPEDAASLSSALEIDDGTTVSLEEFKKSLEDYNGRIVLRIPRSMHKLLKEEAAIEGVSLNQYMLYKLAR